MLHGLGRSLVCRYLVVIWFFSVTAGALREERRWHRVARWQQRRQRLV